MTDPDQFIPAPRNDTVEIEREPFREAIADAGGRTDNFDAAWEGFRLFKNRIDWPARRGQPAGRRVPGVVLYP